MLEHNHSRNALYVYCVAIYNCGGSTQLVVAKIFSANEIKYI